MSTSGQDPVAGGLQREIEPQGQRCANLSDRLRHAELAMVAASTAAGGAASHNTTMETVPTEIWQAIFIHVLESYPIGLPFSEAKYNKNRAEVPFWLAAVCRRWRDVSMHTSELWTYIASPPVGRFKGPALKNRLVLLLERSNPRPIDVIFHSYAPSYALRWAWEQVMPPVIDAFHRWRRVNIDIPPQERPPKQWFLQRDAPFLEEAYIHWATTSAEHFSVVPVTSFSASQALRALHAPASLISPQITLPVVSSLGIDLDVSKRLALQLIGRMPTLLDLTISATDVEQSEPPSPLDDSGPVCLARLRSLTISGSSESVSALLCSLQAPNLQTLILRATNQDGLSNAFIGLLGYGFPGIEALEFDAPADDDDSYWTITEVLRVAILAFPNLRHLTLSNCRFSTLRVFASAVWPALESITLRGRSSYSERDYLYMGTVLGRAVWSAGAHADRAGDGLPHRAHFQLFIRDIYPVPAWLPRNLGSLYGPENVHVFDENGEEIPVDSEDEACFTDSDGSASSSSESEGYALSSSESDSGSSCYSDELFVTANGPDWVSDEYEDDPSWESEGSSDS